MSTRNLCGVVVAGFALAACQGGSPPSPAPTPSVLPTPVASATATPTPTPLPTPTSAATVPPTAPDPRAGLRDPARAQERAPSVFRARFDTTKGPFVVEVHRDWAPRGADRFYNLTRVGFFDEIRFFRVIAGFMVQFGIQGDPAVAAAWREATVQDDPVKQSNRRGMVTFATAGPNTRTTQVFINFKDNVGLDGQGFAPFGQIVEGMSVVDSLFSGYGEGQPQGAGPEQGRLQAEGNAYLKRDFAKLDSVKTAKVIAAPAAQASR
jgi:peptidyl-prolyl cis-trans isomerase A (cyclophilin A)